MVSKHLLHTLNVSYDLPTLGEQVTHLPSILLSLRLVLELVWPSKCVNCSTNYCYNILKIICGFKKNSMIVILLLINNMFNIPCYLIHFYHIFIFNIQYVELFKNTFENIHYKKTNKMWNPCGGIYKKVE